MNTELCPGDMVTGYRGHDNFLARPAGTDNWTLRLPQYCIMTVVEPPTRRDVYSPLHVTVLLEDRLLEVFLNDVERLFGTKQ